MRFSLNFHWFSFKIGQFYYQIWLFQPKSIIFIFVPLLANLSWFWYYFLLNLAQFGFKFNFISILIRFGFKMDLIWFSLNFVKKMVKNRSIWFKFNFVGNRLHFGIKLYFLWILAIIGFRFNLKSIYKIDSTTIGLN